MLASLLAVIHHNADGMLVVDRHGVILLVNPAAERLLGKSASALGGTPFGTPLASASPIEIDVVSGGTARTAEMRVVDVQWEDAPAFLVTLHDVTDRKQAAQVLARVGAQHAALALLGREAVSGLTPEALVAQAAKHVQRVLDADFAGVFASPSHSDDLRLQSAEWAVVPAGPLSGVPEAGSQPRHTLAAAGPVVMDDAADELRFTAWPPDFVSAMSIPLHAHEERLGVIQASSLAARRFDADEITFVQSVADLLAAALARVRAEDQVRHQALHDPLTGLPNRALFADRLRHALARSRRERSSSLAVLFADLDGFKHVNDSLGHHAGDAVLVDLARRLSGALRSSDTLARFGGDEFMILLEGVKGEAEIRQAVERVRATITDVPFVVEGQHHALDLTIGSCRADDSHHSPQDLIRDADAAMYRAKQHGRGGYAVFDSEMRHHAGERTRVERELRGAAAAGQLRLLYQPIVSLGDGRIVELEALLRWQHPERGLLEPADFLEVAIESRLIIPVGTWALREACRQAAAWPTFEGDRTRPTVNVNLSASELAQPQLRETVRAAVGQGGGGVLLQLELIEGALIEDLSLPATLRELSAESGVRFALDDFGTGYSSLAYLTQFKIDELKIDRAFVRTLTRGQDAPIVTAIVNMAHALGILVVAEGVETEEQASEVRRLGCDRAQGFYYARPLTPDAVTELLRRPTLLPAPAGR